MSTPYSWRVGPGLGYMTRWGIFQEQPKNFRGDRYIEIETSRQYGARYSANPVGWIVYIPSGVDPIEPLKMEPQYRN